MVLPTSLAPFGVSAARAAGVAVDLGLPAVLALRGGGSDAVEGFDMGLIQTRLSGLAYSTVTTLMIGQGLSLFGGTPRNLEPIPDDPEEAKEVKLNNTLKIIFGTCMSLSVALAIYTTTVYTLMSIYSKTALGLGLQRRYLDFFNAQAKYRAHGFNTFVLTIITFNLGWCLSLILRFEGPLRWIIPIPAILVSLVGMSHYRTIGKIAGQKIYGSG